jgi:hypothetical protein
MLESVDGYEDIVLQEGTYTCSRQTSRVLGERLS